MLKIKVKQNIFLKQAEVKEAKGFFDYINKNRDHLKKWINWINFIQTIEHEKQYLESLPTDIHKADTIALGIWEEDKVIGSMGLINIDRMNKSAVFGYGLDQDYQHMGIITDSGQKFLTYAFKELGLHRIEVRIAQNNFRSKAVARRLGFKSEGTLRQAYYLHNTFIDCDLFSKLKNEH